MNGDGEARNKYTHSTYINKPGFDEPCKQKFICQGIRRITGLLLIISPTTWTMKCQLVILVIPIRNELRAKEDD
jgi:hypothetical protein